MVSKPLRIALLLLTFPGVARGQEATHEHAHAGLGAVHFPNSGAAAAQPPFLRGLALLHSFEYQDAGAAFREAQQADPSFAMPYWGEALTFSQPLWGMEQLDSARAVLRRLGPTAETRVARARTARERAYGAAVEAFFADTTMPVRARGFADSLRALAAREPDDQDAAAFAALALLILANNDPALRGVPSRPLYAEAIVLGERVFEVNPQHPGATHYLIHAYDRPGFAERGLRFARAYAEVAPDAEHALHMPSHIFVQLGLWSDVAASNERSWAASRAWVARQGRPAADLDFHSLAWLQYAYLQQGRWQAARALIDTAEAVLAGADLAIGYPDARFALTALPFAYASETGRWTDPAAARLAVPANPSPDASPDASPRERVFLSVMAHQARIAAIHRGDSASAPLADQPATFQTRQLQGVAARARGDLAAAVAYLTEAAALEAVRGEPIGPPLYPPSAELLGGVLLEAGRPAEAARAFERVLASRRGRAASLLGLARAQAARGDPAAAATYRRLAENWVNADGDIPVLAEVRAAAR
jgi:tetratricopeptide (TPR) repeat protein